MLKPRFREDKATQAAGLLLERAGGQMNHMKLVKLVYIIDREALLAWGRPITFDSYVSMKLGPVVSETLDLINEEVRPGQKTYWHRFISERERYAVNLLQAIPTDELSEAEIRLIGKVFDKYGHLDQWQLVDITHEFPEWKDPGGGAITIEYRDVLEAGGRTPIEVASILEEIESLALVDRLLP